ncbi:MAG: hypothetical protein J6K28_05140 [Alistipes sp.]|nr:hypothetical protein [Alistipes sp.]
MRRISYIIVTVLLLAATIASCNRRKASEPLPQQPETEQRTAPSDTETPPVGKVRIEKIEGYRGTGLMSGDLTVRVDNSTRYDITLEECTVTLFYSDSKVCAVTVREAVTAAKRSVAGIVVPLGLQLGNPLAAYGVWNKVQRGELDNMTVSVEALVKAGIIRRKVEKEHIPLEVLLDMTGVSAEDIRNMVK